MDAVELNYPVEVATPTLVVGSEMKEAKVKTLTAPAKPCSEPSPISVLASLAASMERCSSSLTGKGATSSIIAFDSTLGDKVPNAELSQHANQQPCSPGENSSKGLRYSGTTSIQLIRTEEAQTQKKPGKVLRSTSGGSKRPRALSEEARGQSRVNDTKDLSDKQGSPLTKSDSQELGKQKNNSGSKRGDRRIKLSLKTKNDSFSVMASMGISSAAGGNNLHGLYGLKTDAHDVTKHVDDILLNDLLDGTYVCPILGEDKGKKSGTGTENIVHSVRKACSILQPPRTTQSQNFTELDSCSNEKMSTCPSSSVCVSFDVNGDNGDSTTTVASPPNKGGSYGKPETPVNLLKFSFDQPKDTLERLALPQPKDLDSLLLDAAKPTQHSRSAPDPRTGKQASRGASLPPFLWSQSFNGHPKSNSDAVKLLTSRSMCQGIWLGIPKKVNFPGNSSDSFTDLESLVYDEMLIPSSGSKPVFLLNNVGLSSAAAGISHALPESGGVLNNEGKVELCPKVLAAAQTLCDIANQYSRLNHKKIMKLPKKPSQKAMKAGKPKSNEKSKEIFAGSTSPKRSGHAVTRIGTDQTPSKRPKLSTIEYKKDLGHINGIRRGSINWAAPKASRSPPKKSVQDSTVEARPSVTSNGKHSSMMPPPARVLDRNSNGPLKVRKLVLHVDWNRKNGGEE